MNYFLLIASWPQFKFLFLSSLPPLHFYVFGRERERGLNSRKQVGYLGYVCVCLWSNVPSDTRALFLGHWHILYCCHKNWLRNSGENEMKRKIGVKTSPSNRHTHTLSFFPYRGEAAWLTGWERVKRFKTKKKWTFASHALAFWPKESNVFSFLPSSGVLIENLLAQLKAVKKHQQEDDRKVHICQVQGSWCIIDESAGRSVNRTCNAT